MAAPDAASRKHANWTSRIHSQANRETLNRLRYEDTEKWDQRWDAHRTRLMAEGKEKDVLQSAMRTAMQNEYRNDDRERWESIRREIVEAIKAEVGWVDARPATNSARMRKK